MKVGASVIAIAFVMLSADPASACSRTDGSVPGSDASTVTVAAADKAFYVDDRDYADLDDDGEAGGVWIYEESNGEPGLQRGGYTWWQDATQTTCGIYVEPIQVLPPDGSRPVLPNGLTLFPNGFGGGTPECGQWYLGDDCADSPTPDRLWF